MLVTILTDMSRQHIIRLDLVAVVFLGGCVGTGLRYALSLIPEAGTFHIGTFTANMIACFAYATLSAWLGGAAAIKGRMKEYVNRGFGMGMCGGLSTMSTLALEGFTGILGGQAGQALLYLLVSVVLGLLVAFAGVWCADRLATGHRAERTAAAGQTALSGDSGSDSSNPVSSAEQEARQ